MHFQTLKKIINTDLLNALKKLFAVSLSHDLVSVKSRFLCEV